MAERIAIVGGGLAGLSAMVRLVEAGQHVELFESRPILGGRAGSFLDPTTKQLTDNCQHVTLSCCTYLDDFCRRIGAGDHFRYERTLHFIDRRGHISRLRAGVLPAPLHLTGSFLLAKFISWSDKVRIALGMWAMMREPSNPAGDSVEHWLRRHYQNDQTIERFWNVVLVSALNESLDQIDYQYARQVFVTGMLSNKQAMTMAVPTVSLSELYHHALIRWADRPEYRSRVAIHLSHPVKQIVPIKGDSAHHASFESSSAPSADASRADGQQYSRVALITNQAESIPFDRVILAVPWHRTADLLAEELRPAGLADELTQLSSSPITSVHFWFERSVMNTDHLVVVGRTTQWLFRRLHAGPGEYVQAVISASDRIAQLSNEEIKAQILAEVHEILPNAKTVKLEHARVVTERHATYSVKPGIDRYRPTQSLASDRSASCDSRVILAGDYTATNWPATMEGAVKSGVLAANSVLQETAQPLAADIAPLPTSWLARILIR